MNYLGHEGYGELAADPNEPRQNCFLTPEGLAAVELSRQIIA